MRLLESALVLTVAFAAFLHLRNRSRRLTLVVTVAAATVCVLNLYVDGGRFQMLSVYGGLLLLVLLQIHLSLARITPLKFFRWGVVSSIFVLCMMTLVLSYILPLFKLPKPTGPHPVGTRTFSLVDPSRREQASSDPNARRELVIQLWYPSEPSQYRREVYRRWAETSLYNSYQSGIRTNSRVDAPPARQESAFPVVLFNPGWGGRRTSDTFLTEDLASHGYVVVSIDHPYNAAGVALPGGRLVKESASNIAFWDWASATSMQIEAAWSRECDIWTADSSFVLDHLQAENADPSSAFFRRLLITEVGAVGYSFGGSASLQVLGADSRVRSAINMDGWTINALRNRTSSKPIMLLYEEASRPHPENLHSTNDYQRIYAEIDAYDAAAINPSLKRYGGLRLYIAGTTHEDFTDQPLVSPLAAISKRGAIAPARMEAMVRAYILAFLDQTLKGKKAPLLASDTASPYHEVKSEVWPARDTKVEAPDPN